MLYNTDYDLFDFSTYMVIAYVIVFTTFLTFLFNIYALRQVSPSVAGSYTYVQPAVSFVIVFILSMLLNDNTYNEDVNWIKITSCLLVIIGVYLISMKPKTFS